jgi:MFS family permease
VDPSEPQAKVLNKTVLKLGLVSFFADVASEMLYPLTPIFLTSVLGASVFNVGLIEGCAEGTASLLKTYSGFWSDKLRKRKTFIWLGYLLAAIAKPLTGASTSWTQVFGARCLDRFGKGIRTAPRDALLSEAVDEKNRGLAFGYHRAMDTMGAAVGPLFAIYFLSRNSDPQSIRSLYYLAIIPGLASVLIALSVRESKKPASTGSPKALSFGDFSWVSPDFKRYLIGLGLFALVNSSDVFLLLKARQAGLSLITTILLYAFYNLLYALASPSLGQLSDKIGRKKVLIAGLFIFALVYACFGFATEAWEFWLLFGIYGVYMAATDGVGKAWAIDLVPKELKASGVGLVGTVSGFATIAASSVAGLLWDRAAPHWTFLYGSIGAVLAIAVLLSVGSSNGEAGRSRLAA